MLTAQSKRHSSALQLTQGLRAVLLNETTSKTGTASVWRRKGLVEIRIQNQRAAISPRGCRLPSEMTQSSAPHLPQRLCKTQPCLSAARCTSARNANGAAKGRVTVEANDCSIIRSQHSNAEFGICQVCICLHYLHTAGCTPEQMPEEG